MALISHLDPTPDEKRLVSLDILRGFAVIGIFVVNIQIMGCHFVHRGACKALWTSPLDQAISMLIKLFFVNKFLSIFSFLFGLGIAMQFYRHLRKNTSVNLFFIRRLGGLLLIGALHIMLFWSGDILLIYALLGLLLLYLLRKSKKALLGVGLLVLVFPFYHQLFGFISDVLHFNIVPEIDGYTHQDLLAVNLQGSYFDTIKLRVSEYLYNLQHIHTGLVPRAFFMFTIGALLVRKGVLSDIEHYTSVIKWKMITAFIISFLFLITLYNLILPNMYILDASSLIILKKIIGRVTHLLYSLSNMVIAMFYIWLITYSLRLNVVKTILSPLQYIGKMALTNYVMHSVIALFLFSSVGFGMYGSVSPTTGILIVLLVCVIQILWSKVWLTYFLYGPLEWCWRCFSYYKYLPMRKYPHAVVSSQSPENYHVL
ncbi:MAG: DUF418 domain-containing protein [Rhodothermaceae bacterium]|nr:DUF418 domain-containing protein [Rhodothermaceae bacterium]